MKKSFDHITNSWLYRTGAAIGNVVIMSALFMLFCLPIVTAGASASALYYTVYRKYRKKYDSITQDFMRSLKENLKDGIIIHLLYTFFCAVVGFNLYFAFFGINGVKLPEWYIIVSFIPLLPVVFSYPFVYPLLARFKNNIKGTITNSITLCMMNFPKFILIWLILIVALAVTICFPPAMLVTPVAATYLIQMITEKAFASASRVENARQETAEENVEEETVESEEEIGSGEEDDE